jgi:predicted transcriptional regulator
MKNAAPEGSGGRSHHKPFVEVQANVTGISRAISRCGGQLEPVEKLVLLNLVHRKGHNPTAWPSQDAISRDTGYSVSYVQRALRKLEELGLIQRRRRNRGRSNEYPIDFTRIARWFEERAFWPVHPSG